MKKTLFIAIVLIIIAATGFVFYTYYYVPKMSDAYNEKLDIALKTFAAGDYASSVAQFTQLANSAPNKPVQGRVNDYLASSLMMRNQSGDQSAAVKIFESVFFDNSISPIWRAYALNNLAALVVSPGFTVSSYQLYFSNPPFNSFLPTSGSDTARLLNAYSNILKLSDQTSPTSYAEYSIAGNYYLPLLASEQFVISTTSQATATQMQSYVSQGDALNDSYLYSPSILLNITLYRALALGGSNRILNNQKPSTIDAAYQLVLQKASTLQISTSTGTGSVYGVLMRTRFFYANFLTTQTGTASQIQTLLAPFGQADPSDVNLSYFVNLKNASNSNFTKSAALNLASISPDFKTFLIKAGVLRK